MRLRRLSAEAYPLVTRELASGAMARLPEVSYESYLEDLERPIDLQDLCDVVEDLILTTGPHDAQMDHLAAPRIHRALPLSRREAAHPGVWRFLALVACPQFVRHRWEARSWATTRSRYWSLGTRPDSNAFARLWWIAELTRDGNSYELTEEVLARQPMTTPIFVRQFSSYRPAVAAFVQVMRTATSSEIERVARELNGRLSTLTLEVLDEEALRAIIDEIWRS